MVIVVKDAINRLNLPFYQALLSQTSLRSMITHDAVTIKGVKEVCLDIKKSAGPNKKNEISPVLHNMW